MIAKFVSLEYRPLLPERVVWWQHTPRDSADWPARALVEVHQARAAATIPGDSLLCTTK